MKVMSLSQNCTSILNASKNYIAVNSGNEIYTKNQKTFTKDPKDFDKSLQKVYCLSGLGFLTFLTGFYAVTAYICGKTKETGKHLFKMI